ncbi:hypothetical protein JAAARDRAFT_143636, partial [Jaapia argillacea MUCL 33604]
ISPKQTNWVTQLPSIEFAINLAQSSLTGFAPFFLNTGQMPQAIDWQDPGPAEYPGICTFTSK